MRRVVVIGCSGAGKSYVATRLGAAAGIPVVHLDALYRGPGRTRPDEAAWAARQRSLGAAPAWVMDGNHASSLPIRLRAADTVVWLDLGTAACVRGVLARWARRGGTASRPAWPSIGLLAYVLAFRRRHRPRLVAVLTGEAGGARIIRLRSRCRARAFVRSLGAPGGLAPRPPEAPHGPAG